MEIYIKLLKVYVRKELKITAIQRKLTIAYLISSEIVVESSPALPWVVKNVYNLSVNYRFC